MPKQATPKKPRLKRMPRGPHGGVQLLLIQSVDHLGKQGDVVEVKSGYAHNYLLPQGLATHATDHHKRMVEKHKAKLHAIERSRLATCSRWPMRWVSKVLLSKRMPTTKVTSMAASALQRLWRR